MTGSVFTAMDVVGTMCYSVEKRGGLEKRGIQIERGGRVPDFFLCMKIAVLLACQLTFCDF